MLNRTPMKCLLLMSFIIFGIAANAKTYYISNSGSDDNSGTDASAPWQTLNKLNSFRNFAPGDNILFRRGDTWHGSITVSNAGRAGSPITYGAYGSGAKPVITGFSPVTSWTNKGGNIWESTNAVSALSDLKMVLINGKSTPMGRYPNGDASYPFLPSFHKFQSSTGTGSGASSITSNSLGGGNNWTGADVVMRVNQWAFHREVITSQSGNTLNFTGLGDGLTPNWGFFIQNDIRTLDQQDEWYYNPSTKKISVYSLGVPTDVQISTVDALFYLYSNSPSVNSTSIDNINFTGANTNAIWISGNLTFSVINCDVSYSGLEGMLLYGGGIQSSTISNNTFYGCGSASIRTTGTVSSLTITNNDIKVSGIVSVYKQDDYTDGGITISAPNSLIQYNTVDSSAYCGINFSGENVQVRNNFVNHSALVRGDAAGIYTGYANQTGKVIDGNIVLNSTGNPRGARSDDYFAFGIYIDDLGNNLSVTNNTMANCSTGGLYIHNSNNLTVKGNTVYNCGATSAEVMWGNGGITIDGNANKFSNTIYSNSVSNNIVFATNQFQYVLNYYAEDGGGNQSVNFGTIDFNYYVKINSPSTAIKSQQTGINGNMSLSQWRSLSKKDINSREASKTNISSSDLRFEYNATTQPKTISLDANYIDVTDKSYPGSVTLQPYSSVVLIKNGSLAIPNTPPVANAGSDTTIYLPANVVTLQGKGNDADGTVVSYHWEMISGPDSFAIANPSSAITKVTGLAEGIYSFELTVTDDRGAVGKDTAKIYIVKNAPPVANAGDNQTITFPVNSVQLKGNGSSAKGTITSYHWEMVSGPASYTIANPSSATTLANGLTKGIYSFELTVTDDKGDTGKDVVLITVNGAQNAAPVADAGDNKSIILPVNSVQLQGSGNDADGSVVSYQWKMISGPSSFTIADSSSSTTQVTDLIEGSYSFELTVTDDQGAVGKDMVQIIVNPAPNTGPVADAGNNQSVTLPVNKTQLQGSGIDADGSVVSYQWKMISGPSSFTIADSSSSTTQVSGLIEGIYSFELTVTDDRGAVGKDVVQIIVNPAPNATPVADAGDNQSVTLPVNKAQLQGSGIDADGSVVSYQWKMISGPSSFTIADSSSSTTQVTDLIEGSYSIELTVTDDQGAVGKDVIQIVVSGTPNIAPVADAGDNQSVTLPVNSVQLQGSSSDTGSLVISYQWKMISGPDSFTIADSSSSTTQVTDLIEGSYSFELAVTDDRGSVGKDVVQVIVNPAPNTGPVADAGNNQSVTLPVNKTQLQGSGIDADGSVVSYQWKMISGPSSFTIADSSSSTTQVSGLIEGIYSFELTVTDNKGAIGKDVVQVTVFPGENINTPPVANAGGNQSITLPINNIQLQGSGGDDDPDGSVTSYQWQAISGPVSFTIADSSSSTTQVTNLAEGIYSFELTVKDNKGAIGKDVVQIIVNPAPNISPVADAGPNITITLPNNKVSLSGKGTDTDGTVISHSWEKIAGPSRYIIDNPASANTTISNLEEGSYSFQLTVKDNKGAIGKDVVQIIVNPAPNISPIADAGPNITITLPNNKVSLSGKGTDSDGAVISYSWEKITGPSNYKIDNSSSANTTISNLEEGLYFFELTVKDNKGAIGKDVVEVIVNPAPNISPIADAGSNITITLPSNTVSLSGKGTDSDGTIVSYYWEKITGPSNYKIDNPASANTTLSNLAEGSYSFQLTVKDDKGAIGKDAVQIIVNPAPNISPIADAGSNITITLPANTVSLSGKGTDADGTIVSYFWEKITGPSNYKIDNPASANTTLSNLAEGSYSFQLTVKDNKGATGKDVVQIIVNPVPNVAPVANAGSNITITLPANTVSLSGKGTDSDGTIISYYWDKIAGPSNYKIGAPSSANTTVSNLVEGSYSFQLTVKDNKGSVGESVVQVVVNPAPNIPPVADAGKDNTITLPVNTVILSGKGTDTDGTIVSYRWAKIAGPSLFNIINPALATTEVSLLVEGKYTFQLTVTDNKGSIGKNNVEITVKAANLLPVANAGAGKSITLPVNTATLSGGGTDQDGNIVSYKWTKVSGPGTFNIVNASSPVTDVFGLTDGVYLFELTVTDNNNGIGKDRVQITVNKAQQNIPPQTINLLPMVYAGNDTTVVYSVASITLSGTASDPDGKVVSYLWKQVAGPGSAFISIPDALTTNVSNFSEGTYTFELTVTDNNGGIKKDSVNIILAAGRLDVHETTSMKLYPNPVSDIATLEISGLITETNLKITILDIAGRIVYTKEFVTTATQTTEKIDAGSFKSGTYVLTVFADGNRTNTLKFIKL